MKTLQKINVGVMLTILLLLLAFLVWFYVRWTGPSNAEIKSAVEAEERSAKSILNDIKNGRIGKITFERWDEYHGKL